MPSARAHRQHVRGAAGAALALACRQQEGVAAPALLLNQQRVLRPAPQQATAGPQDFAAQGRVGGAGRQQKAPTDGRKAAAGTRGWWRGLNPSSPWPESNSPPT